MSQRGNQKLERTSDCQEKLAVLSFRFQMLLICSVVLFLFYPSINSEICLLDDRDMLNSYSLVTQFDLMGTFFPNSREGLYYRPMIGASFLLDRFLWNLDPAIMHLENILFHFTNSLLIFLSARRIISKTCYLPLFASLIFAVHPIATESVNWISGRTDLLAVMFILASLYSTFCYRQSRKFLWIAVAVVTLILGVLTKETAIGLIPALVFILSSEKTGVARTPHELRIERQPLIVFLLACSLSLSAALLFYNHYLSIVIALSYFIYLLWCRRGVLNSTSLRRYLLIFTGTSVFLWALFWGIRRLAFSTQSPHVARTLGLLFTDMNHTLSLFFRGCGFYVRKFLYPFPQNFVIRDVSPYYSLFGILLLCLVVVLIVKRRLPDSLVIAGFWMIAPVLPLTFESIAWTSYAERYVYPAAPFWILAMAAYLSSAGFDHIPVRIHKACLAVISLLTIVMAASTFQRNIVWQTNLALFKDSVEKTPDYKPVRGLYMTALYEKGLYDEALEQYHIAQAIPLIQFKYNPNYELFYVQLLITKNRFVEAEQVLDIVNNKTKGKEPGVYETYIDLATQMVLITIIDTENRRIKERMAVVYDKWYELTKDPMLLYRKGQFMLSLNMRSEAGTLFAKAATVFPENNPYRGYSEKLAKTLGT